MTLIHSDSKISTLWSLKLLDHLERHEARLLSWGLVDGYLTPEDMERLAESAIQAGELPVDLDTYETLQALMERHWIVRLEYPDGPVYRTRMSESVRLLTRLKQLFPNHLQGRGWQLAPNLVSDFRFALGTRRYPKRDLDAGALIEQLRTELSLSDRAVAALAILLRVGTPRPTRLARFQVEATRDILSHLRRRHSTATIVSAGTGSGKTLAFYAPALAYAAAVADTAPSVNILALYPRNELLKDQLSEALKSVRLLNGTAGGSPRLQVGAYFGETPRRHDSPEVSHGGPRGRQGWVCPFIRCPLCEGPLTWLHEDRIAQSEVLKCLAQGCGATVGPDDFLFTRRAIQAAPPDILFTTTEMLNRHMTDTWAQHVFGLGPRAKRKPRLMLLDEAHTYSGLSGAQTAYLIRRWHHMLASPVEFVGLSATLRDPQDYLSQLTGIARHFVSDITPSPEDLEAGGNEYMIALRGDPVSGASLLSTSIQTAMLLRRALDPNSDPLAVHGTRLFVFTDDLDVTNRLYNDLLDAEAVTRRGVPSSRRPLATLRAPALPDRAKRLVAGQSWDMSEELGFDVGTFRARVSRTSSQDVGVDQGADIIVATASLEVGFNDPAVGAILQHKAPLDAAQFIQRRGRAGRNRLMRPWTVVVLSDYGRDRLAYQGYDLLFDPDLQARSLPLGNQSVLKIQAAWALLDWLSIKGTGVPTGTIWRDLAGPAGDGPQSNYILQRQRHHLDLVSALLQDEDLRQDLAKHLERALAVTPETVQSLLWDPPRALVTSLLPTIRRRLLTQWRSGLSGARRDYIVDGQPIPDFVPGNLFSDLILPEVQVITPEEPDADSPSMPVAQALREFAPGRVNYRFGIGRSDIRHWIPVEPTGSQGRVAVDVSSFVPDSEELGDFTYIDAAGVSQTIRCMRPWSLLLAAPPKGIADASNAFPIWGTEIVSPPAGVPVDLPTDTVWSQWIIDFSFFLHAHHSSVEMRRFALGSEVSLTLTGGHRQELTSFFTSPTPIGQEPVGLGFTMDVDAVRIRLDSGLQTPVVLHRLTADDLRALRTSYHHYLVTSAPALEGLASIFDREWLAQLYSSVVTMAASNQGQSFEDAQRRISGGELGTSMVQALDVVFEALPEERGPGEAVEAPGRVYERLRTLCQSPDVQQVLLDTLNDVDDTRPEYLAWVGRRLQATIGAAVVQAIQRLCPDVDASGSLVVDLQTPPDGGGGSSPEIWITENNPGGGGVLQRVFVGYAEDPRRFFRLVESVLRPTDYELVDLELARVLEWSSGGGEFAQILRDVRSAPNHEELQRSFSRLLDHLRTRGVHLSHAVVAGLTRRVLRPGSNQQTDALLRMLLNDWRQAEASLGREIDARVFAYCCKDRPDIEQALVESGLDSAANTPQWRFGVIYGLLWPRGWLARAHALSLHSPFTRLPFTDSWLLRQLLTRTTDVVTAPADGELPVAARAILSREGALAVVADPAGAAHLRATTLKSVAEPIEVGYLHAYPRVVGVERGVGGLQLSLDLGDIPQ